MKSKLSATRGWLIVIFGLILATKTAVGIWRVYKSRDQIILAQKSAEEVKAENENLKKQLAKVQTDEFVIEEARTKLGYARTNETLINIPQVSNAQYPMSNGEVPNWKKWWDLWLRLDLDQRSLVYDTSALDP